jgi:MFS family permease
VHARNALAPVLDLSLLRLPTMYAAVVGGFVYRAGIGALPFLLPLLLQLGFNFTAFQAGLFTIANIVGAMGMKTIIPIALRKWGFRKVLTVNALLSSATVAACALFVPGISYLAMVAILGIGGFFRSLQFTSLNTISYADIEHARMSRATTLVSVGQQLSISVGVAIGALAVDASLWWRGHATITAADFQGAFVLIGVISASSAMLFARMPHNAGAELARRDPGPQPGPTQATDQKLG